ncbi:MAG TPA: hypothetical protein VD694_07340 [Nitrososphaeraceae archaeon]|nr:hypothetical protein [Nitrososphaeraceae archaeon]
MNSGENLLTVNNSVNGNILVNEICKQPLTEESEPTSGQSTIISGKLRVGMTI